MNSQVKARQKKRLRDGQRERKERGDGAGADPERNTSPSEKKLEKKMMRINEKK